MKITDALRGEHGVLYALFERIETGGTARSVALAHEQAALLAAALVSHAHLEDTLLFAALARTGDHAAAGAMAEEHELIAQALAAAQEADDFQAAHGQLLRAVDEARAHFAREEQMIFPAAEASLGAGELEALGHRWAEARAVAVPGD